MLTFSSQDQNGNNENEMSSPPEKRKRGRPPKHRLLEKDTGGMEEKKSSNGNSSASPELSEGNTTKRKRGRPPKEAVEYFSTSLAPSDLLLLDLDEIAPRGMTRQASKELALVSLRKKQEHDHTADSSSENRSASLKASSDTKRDNSVEFEPIDGEANAVYSEQDSFEVIEISSQSTVDDEQEYFSQDSKPALMKECIVISSQSESEEEGEKPPLKSSLNSDKTKLKKKNKKLQSVTQEAEKDRVGKAENSLGKKKGVTKLKKSLSVENQAKAINYCASIDNFPPVEFGFESRASPNDMESSLQSSINQEGFEIETSKVLGEPEQHTDENSNQVKSLLSRADLSKKLSVSKMQMLRKTMKVKNRTAGGLDSDQKSDVNERSADLSNITDASFASTKNSSAKLSPMSVAESSVSEASARRRENNEMEISARTPLQEDTSQLHNQLAPTMKKLAHEEKNKGKAKRTEGKPKSLRGSLKKRPSIDKTAATQQNPTTATECSVGKMNDAQGKIMDKHNITSRTADLLPMQNRTNSAPLMDGDLIGAIIQGCGKDTDSKGKSVATAPAAKKEEKDVASAKKQNKAQDEAGNFRSWVSFI